MIRRRRTLHVGILYLVLIAGCASRRPGDPLKPGFNVFSKEQDIQLGRQAAQEVLQQVDVVRDESLQNYVKRIGQALATQPAADGYPYTFTLINDKNINAFALPGGPVFINTGTLAAAENEAQFAGVLAHEISHVALRHATNQASKANIIQLPAVLAGAVIGQGSVLAQLGQAGLGLGVNSILLRYSRSAETEADALGARIMSQAGYNPVEMARFFEKLESQGGDRAPEFLSSHPNPGNRVKQVQAEIQTLPQRQYNAGTGQFAPAKQELASLPPPREQTRARTAPAAAPAPEMSGGYRTLQSARFAVAYPGGWEVFGDNNSSMVTVAPRQALVQNSRGGADIGYGAVLSYYFPEGGRVNLENGTAQLLSHLRAANPSMEAAGRPRNVRVSGYRGLVTTMVSGSPYGGSERDVVLTVLRPEGLFYMVFIAPDQYFGQLQPAFEQMLQSIRFRT